MNGLTLVTGATGFIGGYLVRRLARMNTPLRVLVRRPGGLEPEVAQRVEIVKGDVRDSEVVAKATQGAHTVFHLAACARAWSPNPQEFTVLTLPPYRPAPLHDSLRRPTPYEETKLAGERLVESYVGGGGEAVIVHPTRVYGPGPLTDANDVTRVVALYIAGRFRVRLADNDVLANYVHAADVAEGIVLAAQRGRSGAHYILGGEENLALPSFLQLVGEIAGRRYRTVALPAALGLVVARAAEFWARLGSGTPITRGWIRVLLEDRRVDITASCEELGYHPRPLRDGLSETIRWLRSTGS